MAYPSYTPYPGGYSLIHREELLLIKLDTSAVSPPYSGKVLFLMSIQEEVAASTAVPGGYAFSQAVAQLELGKVPGFPGAPSQRGSLSWRLPFSPLQFSDPALQLGFYPQ